MLTQTVAGRTFDYSYCIGGRMNTPAKIAIGSGDTMYVLCRGTETVPNVPPNRATGGARVVVFSAGTTAGDEELVAEIGKAGDGEGELTWPVAIALDSEENLYITDEWLNRLSIFDKEGNFLRSWGTSGDGDGEFKGAAGIAMDQQENVFIVDSLNHRVQKLTKDGTFLSKWGKLGSGDGEFDSPWGIALDGHGFVYVADHGNHRVQKFTPQGEFVANFGSHGTDAGQLNYPSDVAVDPDGDVYVCDWANDRVQIFSPEGKFLATLVGDAQQLGKWHQDTVNANLDNQKARRRALDLAREWVFQMPRGVTFDPVKQRILIADTQRSRIQIYNKPKNYMEPQLNL
jgi:DNA-binding beta-propeller fold protein YncE